MILWHILNYPNLPLGGFTDTIWDILHGIMWRRMSINTSAGARQIKWVGENSSASRYYQWWGFFRENQISQEYDCRHTSIVWNPSSLITHPFKNNQRQSTGICCNILRRNSIQCMIVNDCSFAFLDIIDIRIYGVVDFVQTPVIMHCE